MPPPKNAENELPRYSQGLGSRNCPSVSPRDEECGWSDRRRDSSLLLVVELDEKSGQIDTTRGAKERIRDIRIRREGFSPADECLTMAGKFS